MFYTDLSEFRPSIIFAPDGGIGRPGAAGRKTPAGRRRDTVNQAPAHSIRLLLYIKLFVTYAHLQMGDPKQFASPEVSPSIGDLALFS